MIQPCRDVLIPYLNEMQLVAQRTLKTNIEEGFTVGQNPDGTSEIYKAPTGTSIGVNLPRPDKPFLNFHTHGPEDLAEGLSAGDTSYPYFREHVYPIHCVASTGYRKIFCYRPEDIIKHPKYPEKFAEQVDLSLKHSEIILKKYPMHHKKVYDLLEHNKVRDLIRYETKFCPEAAEIMRKMNINWNSFIKEFKCAEFPIQEMKP